jgi:hypothetical protein
MKIILPIYYEQEYKTKPNKKMLVGLNNYRNWHHMISNKVKHWYHDEVKKQITRERFSRVRVHYDVYAQRNGTDGPNIRSILEKFVLDGLVVAGVIEDDKIGILMGDSSDYYIDAENPRIEITIKEVLK